MSRICHPEAEGRRISSVTSLFAVTNFVLLAIFLAGCAQVARVSPVRIPFTDVVPEHEIAPDFQAHPPKSVAVLPFVLEQSEQTQQGKKASKNQLGQEILRRTFFNYFSTLGYADMNLAEVDEKLLKNNISPDSFLGAEVDWEKVGAALGVDAVIRARLTNVSNFTGGVYSQTILSGDLEMIDTRTGNILWHAKHSESSRGGLLLKSGSLLNFLEGEEQNAEEDLAFLKVAEEFSRHVVGTIPDVNLKSEEYLDAEMAGKEVGGRGPVLAVAPFDSQVPDHQEISLYLRRRLIANLREQGLRVMEPKQVDQVIEKRGLHLDMLRKETGAQVLVKGTLTRLEKEYLVVHSQVLLEAELQLVDTQTGVELGNYQRRQVRNAGLLRLPTSMTSAATQPILGLDDYYVFEMANDLARDLAEPIVYWVKQE